MMTKHYMALNKVQKEQAKRMAGRFYPTALKGKDHAEVTLFQVSRNERIIGMVRPNLKKVK